MPSDSNLDKIPQSPIDDDDLWLINREDRSYKVTSKMLGGYLITSPVPEICEGDDDCPPDRLCVDGYCERIPCDSDLPPGQEGCPPGYVCLGDYCYPKCGDPTDPNGGICGDGYICIDPGITGGDTICMPYPFPCRPDLLPGDGCPPGYVCWGGNCYQNCLVGGNTCPPGTECVEFSNPDGGTGYICVPSSGGFPCVDGICPIGYDCFFGMCFAKCGDPDDPNGGICEDGFQCVSIDGNDYCVPYPFPCDLYGPGCPDGMICYNGECYPECDPSGAPCEDGFVCTDIGGGDFICYPEQPTEGFVNDGPLVIRTEPVDYPASPATEKIVFTANQYGRSVLTFEGFDQNPGGPGGGNCSVDGDCPPGYSCVGGVCVYIPCSDDTDCSHPQWTMVCENGFCFPSCSNVDGSCPSGYECVDGICLPGGVHPIGECGPAGECPSGYVCVDGYCVPKPCGIGGADCNVDEFCYNDYCYPRCNNITGCGPNHICVEVVPPTLPDGSDGISICMPIGGGPDGGGSGGDININIDPDWWNPENGLSPINDGPLNLEGKKKDDVATDTTQLVFTSNQKKTSKVTYEWPLFLTPGADLEATVGISTGYYFPKGTRMLFQGAPPAGWTRQSGYEDIALRVVSNSNPGAATGGSQSFTATNKSHAVPMLQHNHGSVLSGSIAKEGSHTHKFTVTRSSLSRTLGSNHFTYKPDELLDGLVKAISEINTTHQIVSEEKMSRLVTCVVVSGYSCHVINQFMALNADFEDGEITVEEFRSEMDDAFTQYFEDFPNVRSHPESHFLLCENIDCPKNSICYYGICVAEPGYTYDESTDSYVEDPTNSVVDADTDGDCDYCPSNTVCVNGICECESGYYLHNGKCYQDGTEPPAHPAGVAGGGVIEQTGAPLAGAPRTCNIVLTTRNDAAKLNKATFTGSGGHNFTVVNEPRDINNLVTVPVAVQEDQTYTYVLSSGSRRNAAGLLLDEDGNTLPEGTPEPRASIKHFTCNGPGCGGTGNNLTPSSSPGDTLRMEDSTDDNYTDLVIITSQGQFNRTSATTGTYNPMAGASPCGGCPVGQELVNGVCVLKVYTSSAGTDHTHGNSFSVSNPNRGVANPTLNLATKYVDVIVAEKD